VRADGAFFDHKIIEFIEQKHAFYAIVAQLTSPLKSRLSGLRYHQVSSGVWAAEFRYCPHGWPGLRRFVVIRRPVPEEPSAQLHLFQMGGYNYQLLVTNLSLTPLHLWRFYNQRARAELIIRELKYAYALGKIPTKDFQANEAFFHIVLLAYNLLNWFKRLCAPARSRQPPEERRFGLIPASCSFAASAFPVPPLHHWVPSHKAAARLGSRSPRFWVPQKNGEEKGRNSCLA